jgi:hypothetical protein
MLVPGLTFGAGSRVAATIGPGTTPDYISQGIGFMNNGNLAIDTNAPTGSNFCKGFILSPSGAVYGKTGQLATDSWVEGVRVSALGQIVYESADAANFASGNPITAAGNFAVN